MEISVLLDRLKEVNGTAKELLLDLKAIAATGTVQLDAATGLSRGPKSSSGDSFAEFDPESSPNARSPKHAGPTKSPTFEPTASPTLKSGGGAGHVTSSLRAPTAVFTITERSFHGFEASVTKLINLSEEALSQYGNLMSYMSQSKEERRVSVDLNSPGETTTTKPPGRSASVVRFAKKKNEAVSGEIDETFSDGGSEIGTETPPLRVSSIRRQVVPPPLRRESVEATSTHFGGLFGNADGAIDGDIARAYSPVASFRNIPSGVGLTRTGSAVSVFSIGGDDEASPFSPPNVSGPGGVRADALNLDFVRQLPISPPDGVSPSTTAGSPRRFSDESTRPIYASNDFLLTQQGRGLSAFFEAPVTESMLSDLSLRFPKLVPLKDTSNGVSSSLSLTREVNVATFSVIELAVQMFDRLAPVETARGDTPTAPSATSFAPHRSQSAASMDAFHRVASAASLGTASYGSMASLRAALQTTDSRSYTPLGSPSEVSRADPGITVMWQLFIDVCLSVFMQYRFTVELGFDLSKFVAFLDAVFWLHSTRDGYHGVLKTIDALHAAHTCLSQAHVAKFLGDVDLFATLLATVTMDIAHPCVTNDFLVRTNHPIANLFGSTAPTENMAVAVTMALLRDPRLNFVSSAWWQAAPHAGLDGHTTNEIVFKDLLSQLIIATNPSSHLQVLHGLTTIFSSDRQLTAQNLSRANASKRAPGGIMRATSFESMNGADAIHNLDASEGQEWLATVRQSDIPVVLQAIVRLSDHAYAMRDTKIFTEWVDSQIVEWRRQHLAEIRCGVLPSQSLRIDSNPMLYHQRVLQLIIAPLLDALPVVPHEWRRCVKANVTSCMTCDAHSLPTILPALVESIESLKPWEDNSQIVLSSMKDILALAAVVARRADSGDMGTPSKHVQGSGARAVEALSSKARELDLLDADFSAPHLTAMLRLLTVHVTQVTDAITQRRHALHDDTFGAELFALVHKLQPKYLGDTTMLQGSVPNSGAPLSLSDYARAAAEALRHSEQNGFFSAAPYLLQSHDSVNVNISWFLKVWEAVKSLTSTKSRMPETAKTTNVAHQVESPGETSERSTISPAPLVTKYFSPYSLGRR